MKSHIIYIYIYIYKYQQYESISTSRSIIINHITINVHISESRSVKKNIIHPKPSILSLGPKREHGGEDPALPGGRPGGGCLRHGAHLGFRDLAPEPGALRKAVQGDTVRSILTHGTFMGIFYGVFMGGSTVVFKKNMNHQLQGFQKGF